MVKGIIVFFILYFQLILSQFCYAREFNLPDHLTESDLDQSISIDQLPFPELVQSIKDLQEVGELESTADLMRYLKILRPEDPIFQNPLYVTRSGGYRGDVTKDGLIDKSLKKALGLSSDLYFTDPASLIEPRIISFDARDVNDGNQPSISIGLPKDQNFFEMHYFDPETDRRDFYFGYIANNETKFVKNPTVCFTCHDKGKPIWGGRMWSIHGLYAWNAARDGLTNGLEHHYQSDEFNRAYGEFLAHSSQRGIWEPFKKYKYPDSYASLAVRLHLLYGLQENHVRLKRLIDLPVALNPRFQASLLMAMLNLSSKMGEEHPSAQILSPRVLRKILPVHQWGHSVETMKQRQGEIKKNIEEAVKGNNLTLANFQDKDYKVFQITEGSVDVNASDHVAWVQYVLEAWGYEKLMDHWATTRRNSYAFTAQYDDSNVNVSELYTLGILYLEWIAKVTDDSVLMDLLNSSLYRNDLVMGTTMEVNYYQQDLHINPEKLVTIINYILNKAKWSYQGITHCEEVLVSSFGTLLWRESFVNENDL